MTEPLSILAVDCPYCGESIQLIVDSSAGAQAYVEDCSVCCRPIECRVYTSAQGVELAVYRDDE